MGKSSKNENKSYSELHEVAGTGVGMIGVDAVCHSGLWTLDALCPDHGTSTTAICARGRARRLSGHLT